jgi:2-polyprenyl-6-methoxyphenol hydroxylase-like FAD-dependent oxidoreductase
VKVMIIGGGIAGATAALSLHAAGIDPIIFDTVSDLRPLGLGINLQPNGVRELLELGLEEALARTGIETSTFSMYNRHAQLVWSEPRGLVAGYRWPQYSIHRGELQAVLIDAVRERVGADSIRLNHHLASFEQKDSAVVAHFVDRKSGQSLGSCTAEALIGADGINSSVRRQLYPDEGEPVWSGRIQWRGCIETEPFLDGRTQAIIGGKEQRVVVYPMSKRAAERGVSLVNWLALLGNQQNYEKREAWDRKVSKDRFFDKFAGWNFGWLNVADLIANTEEIFEYPEADRDPLKQWSFGRVTLLGDAAHPMRPVGSQAGTQAILDARVVARALATSGSVVEALKQYEKERLPVMTVVTLKNRELGPEIVLHMAEERAPDGFKRVEDVIPRQELEDIARNFKKAAGFDPATLNARPSLGIVK